jgi:hypothetical protein
VKRWFSFIEADADRSSVYNEAEYSLLKLKEFKLNVKIFLTDRERKEKSTLVNHYYLLLAQILYIF